MSAARLIAIIGAIVCVGGLILQFGLMLISMSAQGFGPLAITWRFFGYFTILTNTLVAIIWLRALLRPDLSQPRLEGAGAVSIVMVGIIYHLLLAGTWNPQGLEWVANYAHHTVVPILFAIYWFMRPHGALKWPHVALFVIWPLAYCFYALTRGAFDGWYAYYFLDPTHVTLTQLALSIAAQSAAFLVCAFSFVGLDKAFAGRATRSDSAAAPS